MDVMDAVESDDSDKFENPLASGAGLTPQTDAFVDSMPLRSSTSSKPDPQQLDETSAHLRSLGFDPRVLCYNSRLSPAPAHFKWCNPRIFHHGTSSLSPML